MLGLGRVNRWNTNIPCQYQDPTAPTNNWSPDWNENISNFLQRHSSLNSGANFERKLWDNNPIERIVWRRVGWGGGRGNIWIFIFTPYLIYSSTEARLTGALPVVAPLSCEKNQMSWFCRSLEPFEYQNNLWISTMKYILACQTLNEPLPYYVQT